MNRYERQLILKDFGPTAQEKLLRARVLVIGAGGLGCPALTYLAGAGIGTLGIMDGDVVSLSNLHRQTLFSMDDIGRPKVLVAREKLQRLNPEIEIVDIDENINTQNALSVIARYDYILDGSDNFPTRYLINDACVLLTKPLIYGAVSQYEGQVAVFNVPDGNGISANYRDIFPNPPKEGEILNCAQAGVLGVLPGIIGTMQAAEAIKLITGVGTPLLNHLLTYNVLSQETYTLELLKHPGSGTQMPANRQAFENWRYEYICDTSGTEIDQERFRVLMKEATLVDVREYGEIPDIDSMPHLRIPLSQLKDRLNEIQGDTIIFLCQSGVRSQKAMRIYSAGTGRNRSIYSLKGGIRELTKLDK